MGAPVGKRGMRAASKDLHTSITGVMLVLAIGDLHIPNRVGDLPAKFKKLLVPGKIEQIICTGNVCDRGTYDYLRTLANDVHVVRGDYDENARFPFSLLIHYPPLRIGVVHGHQILPPGDASALASLARSMDVDILISGYTHRFETFQRDGRCFVNPGSATGAWSSDSTVPTIPKPQTEAPPADNNQQSEQQEAASAEKAEDAPADKGASSMGQSAPDASEELPPLGDLGTTPSFALLDIQGAAVVIYVYQLIDDNVKVEKVEYSKPMLDTQTS